jgi:hypothetical protein
MSGTRSNIPGSHPLDFPLIIPEKVRRFVSRKEASQRLARVLERNQRQNPSRTIKHMG